MNRDRIDRADRRAMAARKRAIADDNGFVSLHGYGFRWTNFDAQTASDASVRLNNR
ncbi:MAG: hypothetical protein L6300_10235 [Syntrophaceae bacterium]|nr:hypothetical protein [Syntrophaceae bacterium]